MVAGSVKLYTLSLCFSCGWLIGGDIIGFGMDYQQAVDYILSYPDYEKMPMPHDPAFYDLRRVDELLAWLGNPHLEARSIHIAGTNGKGSVAAMVASALAASGYTTGLYTSPHLHTLNERIRVNGELVPDGELIVSSLSA